MSQIKESIQRIAGGRDEVYSLVCLVDQVNITERSVDVSPANGDAPIYSVRLQSLMGQERGVVVVPKKGSYVVVTFLARNDAYVALCEEVDQVLIYADDIQLGGDNGEKAVLGETLNDNLAELNGNLSDLLTHLTTYATAQAAASIGALAPLAPGYSALLTAITTLQATVASWEAKLQQHLSTTTTLE